MGGLSTHASSQEMASDELKEIRKAMTEEAIREHQMARGGGTPTDLFTCGKCRKKSCTYTQVSILTPSELHGPNHGLESTTPSPSGPPPLPRTPGPQ